MGRAPGDTEDRKAVPRGAVYRAVSLCNPSVREEGEEGQKPTYKSGPGALQHLGTQRNEGPRPATQQYRRWSLGP